MNKIQLLFYGLVFFITSCVSAHKKEVNTAIAQKSVIIAYVPSMQDNWGEGMEAAKKITHINYAFANIKDGKVIEGGQGDSLEMAQLRALKKVNPDLKILISVGGWAWSDHFSDAALTPASREIFAQSAIDFLLKHQLDGIDLDWEYPGQPGEGNVFRPEDKENFTAILKLIREKLDAIAPKGFHYLLTVATAANQRYLDLTEMDKASKYLDYVNIMTYDYHGGWSPLTGHHANLYPSSYNKSEVQRSSSRAVEEHLKAGVPADKLVLGVPFYGRWWSEVEKTNQGLYQDSKGERGSKGFNGLEKDYINKNGFVRYWDESAKTPYLWQESTGTFVTYEDEESLKIKMEYIAEKGLAGAMFWQFNGDNEQHSLLNTIFNELK
jgi:chitinase